jgi:hypothetical protein
MRRRPAGAALAKAFLASAVRGRDARASAGETPAVRLRADVVRIT